MTRILLAVLAFYKRWISPAWHAIAPGGCRYVPTCSEYAATAIAVHGPLRGSALAVWRLLRCHPFARGGLDQVPAARGRAAAPSRASAAGPSAATAVHHEPLP